jgi:hypothetical protein
MDLADKDLRRGLIQALTARFEESSLRFGAIFGIRPSNGKVRFRNRSSNSHLINHLRNPCPFLCKIQAGSIVVSFIRQKAGKTKPC